MTSDNKKSLEGLKIEQNLLQTREVKNESSTTEGQSDVSKTVTPNEDDFISINETDLSISKKKTEEPEKQEEYDLDETVDCGNEDKQSEISDDYVSTSEDVKKFLT